MADDIAKWLEGLGLGQYTQVFAENDIDIKNLALLTEDDLKDLGLSLGHRRTLQAALIGNKTGQAPTPVPDRIESVTTVAESPSEAERRQLTVLFCDLIGSTVLSARLDPEDMREVLRAYQDACASAIARYDGYIAKFMGDGVYAYFGYPTAHEDDAERAVRAGLAVVDAVRGLNRDLSVRVGIATGTVAVGDIVGEGAAEEANVVGEAPNLASRLQEIAEPNTVVVSDATRTLVGELFESGDLGTQALKGFDRLEPAWRIDGARRTESRFEATRSRQMTTLIGREEEVEILLRRWERTCSGQGQVVLIGGEPGIGKSRLIHELRARISANTPTVRVMQCSPHHTNSAMFPFVEQTLLAIGIKPDDDDAAKIDKLERWLALASQPIDTLSPVLGPVLGIDTTARYHESGATPQRHKEIVFETFAERLTRLSADHPMLFVVEDAHWIDPTSLELLNVHIDKAQGCAAMIVVTFRPEFNPPWIGRPHTTLMALNRLDADECVALARSMRGGEHLTTQHTQRIAERTDGVPLFVEEMTKVVLESGGTESTNDIAVVPQTLQDSLEARLDRLGPAKDIAQVGSVIGRDFSYHLLTAVAGKRDEELSSALDELVSAEIIFAQGSPPDAVYTFKHALLQDTAYSRLLRGRRAELHARVASVLHDHFPERAASEPELLAHHFTEAGDTAQAIEHWFRAGRAAAERFANSEAIDHFERALTMLAQVPDSPKRRQQELEILLAQGPTLHAVYGIGTEIPRNAYERARALGKELDDIEGLFSATWGLWHAHGQGGNLQIRQELVAEMLALAERSGDSLLEMQAHHAAWGGPFEVRRIAHLDHIKRGLELYDPDRHLIAARRFGGHDTGVCGLVHAAQTLWVLGYRDQAMARCHEALAHAEKISHYPPGLGQAMMSAATLNYYARNWAAARTFAEDAIATGRQCGVRQFVHLALPVYAVTLAYAGEPEAALQAIEDRSRVFSDRELPTTAAYTLPLEGEAIAVMGRTSEAIKRFDQALAVAEELDLPFWVPNTLWQKGQALLALGPGREAEAGRCFETAIDRAQALESPIWKLRAATALARLWHDQGMSTEALDLLAPTYNWFTEGFDTVDLKEAKSLLDELS